MALTGVMQHAVRGSCNQHVDAFREGRTLHERVYGQAVMIIASIGSSRRGIKKQSELAWLGVSRAQHVQWKLIEL